MYPVNCAPADGGWKTEPLGSNTVKIGPPNGGGRNWWYLQFFRIMHQSLRRNLVVLLPLTIGSHSYELLTNKQKNKQNSNAACSYKSIAVKSPIAIGNISVKTHEEKFTIT